MGYSKNHSPLINMASPRGLTRRSAASPSLSFGSLHACGARFNDSERYDVALATYAVLCAKQETDTENFSAALISQMRAIWKEFGMTPTARENLGIDTRPKKPNPFANL
jgi:hypothetical protein